MINSEFFLKTFGFLGGISITVWLAKKVIMPQWRKYVRKTLERAFNPQNIDPEEAELIKAMILANVKYAEFKLPDKGLGPQKKAMVVSKLNKIGLPSWVSQVLSDWIEEAVLIMDEEAKRAISNASNALGLDKPKPVGPNDY